MVEHSYFDVHSDQWHTNGHAALTPAPEAAVPSARTLWREAVAQAAEKARAALPEAGTRVDLAVRLVLQGDVQILEDGTAMVGSLSDPATTYHVNGACTCQDATRAPHGGMCKHRIARGLAIRAQQRLEEKMDHLDATPAAPEPQPAAAPAQGLPEAPASANVFVVIDGHRVQITVRGHTLAGVLTEIRTVLAQFPAQAASSQAAAAPVAPVAPVAEAPVLHTPPPAESWCGVHGLYMQWHEPKPGDKRPGWWSHKIDGQWCRGRVPGAKA